jgi:hypothetical protein
MVRPLLAFMLAVAAPAAAETPPAAPPPAGMVTGRFIFPDRPVWVGEVFDLKFAWQVDWDLFRYLDGDLKWTEDPLATEGWTRDPQSPPASVGGKSIASLSFSTRAMALQPGSIRLNVARQRMQIVTGGYEEEGIRIANIGPIDARSAGATIHVRPLPPAPPNFSGAVGDFALRSTLDRKSGEVGKPIVWTVTLSGTGNWSAFGGVPARQLPRDFDMIGTPGQTAEKGGSLFEQSVTERITIVPHRPGVFSLGPVEMSVFDPGAGRYRVISAPAVTLDARPGAAASPPPAYEAEPDPTPPGETLPPPMPGIGHAWAPLSRLAWHAALSLPLSALGLLWLGLAVARARRADPDRAARRAYARLLRTIDALATASDPVQRRQLVRAWQREAGILLKVDHAAPAAGSFGGSDWATLWDEAERHLYGRDVALPADWQRRADAVLAGHDAPPRFDVRTVFAVRNLYPVAALMVALVLATPAPLPAAHPAPQGTVTPRDWIGHYNLARSEAAAKRWNAAAAQAGIAWVQRPRSAATTALWALAAREAGFGGRSTGGLPLPGEMRGQWAGLLPPLGWQAMALTGLSLAAAGFATLLLRRFGHLSRRTALPATIAGIAGILGVAAGLAGVDSYGPAAMAEAAIVWRQAPLRDLPVDMPDNEAAIILAPGTAGYLDRTFLGWVHLTLTDGRSGWLRRDDLLPLWQAVGLLEYCPHIDRRIRPVPMR